MMGCYNGIKTIVPASVRGSFLVKIVVGINRCVDLVLWHICLRD